MPTEYKFNEEKNETFKMINFEVLFLFVHICERKHLQAHRKGILTQTSTWGLGVQKSILFKHTIYRLQNETFQSILE